jgi:hypothetical protein
MLEFPRTALREGGDPVFQGTRDLIANAAAYWMPAIGERSDAVLRTAMAGMTAEMRFVDNVPPLTA